MCKTGKGECARGKRGRVCKREEGESVQEGRGRECARGKEGGKDRIETLKLAYYTYNN